MQLAIRASDLRNWCVYTVAWHPTADAPAETIFAGMSMVQHVALLEDARNNTAMTDMLKSDMLLTIEVVSVHDLPADAKAACAAYIEMHAPHCNMYGVQVVARPNRNRIRCVTTGVEYANSAQAAAAAGVTSAAMCMHLNRRGYHSTCAGRVYERIEQ